MEIKGTIVQVLPPQSGISKVGNAWKKQEYILENNEGQFPRKICLTTFNQTADAIQLTVGQRITASFDIESREYNGRWYTEVRLFRAVPEDVPVAGAAPAAAPVGSPLPPPPAAPLAGGEDEFPF
ncbi:MAG: DUF3127 domain-containing protein [Muribaculaceae bacterium]|nr:DUF3127 domain-containing protein [Muribaculaceae bacterium]